METNAGRNHAELSNVGTCTFAGFTLDTRRQLLLRGAEPIRLRPRTYDVLVYLVRHVGRLISKQELMDAVWSGVAVTDDSLVQCLMEIRRALGDAQDIIKTVRGRGYLLDTVVRWPTTRDEATSTHDSEAPRMPEAPAVTHDAVQRRRASSGARFAQWSVLLLVATAAAAALAWAIWGRRAQPTAAPIRSLAVMPFENLSGDPEQEYFAVGITDDLITQLSNLSAVRVISRTSVMRFKGTRRPLKEIAHELQVDAIVEGSLLRSSDRIRVTAKVSQIDPERNIWANRYDRPRGDVGILQATLAREIADAIRIHLTPQEQSRLSIERTVDPEAYEALLKGRYFWSKRTEATTLQAIGYFEQAIAKDPREAMAYVGLSDAYFSLALSEALQEALPPNEAFPKARAAAERALEIDPELGEAHASLAHIKFQYDRDWQGAVVEFKRAIELSPNYAYAHLTYGLCLMWMGRVDEAISEMTRARQLDPLFLAIGPNLGLVFARAQHFDRGLEECRKTLELDPAFALAHYRLGQIYILSGKHAEAVAPLQQAVALSNGSPRALAELGLAYALQGNTREARAVVSRLEQRSHERYVSAFNFAIVYGGLREKDRTLALLEAAERERSQSMNFLILSPAFDALRADPRFQALVRHVGLSH